MQLSSLKQISQKARITFRRFPFPITIALWGAVAACWLVGKNEEDEFMVSVFKFVVACVPALSAFTGLTFFCERYHVKLRSVLLFNVGLVLLFTAYYFSLPDKVSQVTAAEFFLLLLSAHLWVSFAPFLTNLEIQGFWQFNKSLFIRCIIGALYSFVLFAGLSIAFLAISNLFDVKIDEEAYARLFILIVAVFNTWFVLSGVPDELERLDEINDYPNGLRILTQFILLPLVTIYLLILYAYGFKILVTFEWPRGWVAYLVIGFSTVGILALLLVWPLRELEGFKWVKVYTRSFFIAVFPLILLLAASIYIRVDEYGITENRYFIIVLAIWLTLNAAYFLFSKVKNIKVIPMSLFFFALFSCYGPWSAFSVSENNQHAALVKFLNQKGMFKDGKVNAPENGIVLSQKEQLFIGSKLDYLLKVHGTESVQDMFTVDIDSISNKHGAYQLTIRLMESLNLEYNRSWESTDERTGKFHYSNVDSSKPLKVEGYASLFRYEFYSTGGKEASSYLLDDSTLVKVSYNEGNEVLSVTAANGDKIAFNLNKLVSENYKVFSNSSYDIPGSNLTFEVSGKTFDCKFIFHTVYGTFDDAMGISSVSSLQTDILFRKK